MRNSARIVLLLFVSIAISGAIYFACEIFGIIDYWKGFSVGAIGMPAIMIAEKIINGRPE